MSRPPDREAMGWPVLAVLLTAYVLAFADRQVLNLLAQPIKRELGLGDFQFSLLQGPAFALLLAGAGLPIGRLIDRRRRVTLLTGGVAFWSVATAACGLASGFGALLAGRVGVGAGEAVMTPGAYSLIGDAASPRRLGRAIGLYAMGPYLGSGLALVGGGALVGLLPVDGARLPGEVLLAPWRAAFLALAAAGAPVALWLALTREPARRGADAEPPPRREVLAWLGRRGWAVAGVNGAVVFAAMATYALSAWIPALLMRRFGATVAEAGRDFGLLVMICGAGGALAAGALGDLARERGRTDGRLRVLAAAAAVAVPFAALAPVAPSRPLALALLAPLLFLATLAVSSGPASLQEITPNRMRGVQHAVAVLAVNLIGLSLGPPLVALVTEGLLHDERRLGLALAVTTPVMLAVSAAVARLAAGPYRRAVADGSVALDATGVPA